MMSDTEKAFRMIFEAMRKTFGESWYLSVPPFRWVIWRRQIKQMLFDEDIIAAEAIAVIGDCDKRKWPAGTGFFSRVRDMVLLGRRQREKIMVMDRSFQSLKEIL